MQHSWRRNGILARRELDRKEGRMNGEGIDRSSNGTQSPTTVGKVSRRAVLRFTALAAAAAPTLGQLTLAPVAQAQAAPGAAGDNHGEHDELVEVSIAQLQAQMAGHRTTSRDITRDYIERIG